MDFSKSGDIAFKKGQSEITTSLLKWSKDYTAAVIYFDEAANYYKKTGQWEKQLLALEKSQMCNENLNDYWGQARNISAILETQISQLNSVDYQKLIDLTYKAGDFFKLSQDSYSYCIKLKIKTAKYLVKNNVIDKAVDLLESGIQDANISEQQYNKRDAYDYCLEVLVDNQMYSRAILLIKKQFTTQNDTKNRYQTPTNGLSIIILCLLQNESYRAEFEFDSICQQIPMFYCSKEYQICEELIRAFNYRNQQELSRLAKSIFVNSINPANIPRLLRNMRLRPKDQNKSEEDNQYEQKEGNNDYDGIQEQLDFLNGDSQGWNQNREGDDPRNCL